MKKANDTIVQTGQAGDVQTIQSALIRVCQNPDIDPDRLEKFLDLQIKMEERQAKQLFNEALAKFQGECPTILKSRKVDFTSKSGTQTKYDYAPLDEMVHVIRPHLKNCGLSFSFNVRTEEKTTKLFTTVRHSAGHCEVTEYEFDTIHDDARMNLSQRRKSALSYAKRAGLENALGLVSQGEDDDARRAIDSTATPEQISEIQELIRETETTMASALKFFKVDRLESLSSYEARSAISKLRQKRVKCGTK